MEIWQYAVGVVAIVAATSTLRWVLGRFARGAQGSLDAAWDAIADHAGELGLARTDDRFVIAGEVDGCKIHIVGQRRLPVGTLRATWITAALPEPLPFELEARSRRRDDTVTVEWQPDWLAHVKTNDDAAAQRLVAAITAELRPLAEAYAAPTKGAPPKEGEVAGFRELVLDRDAVTIELPHRAPLAEVRAAVASATELARAASRAR
ncbi:MAG: hypothetical protein JNL38_18095 [Myxococcales bacterium]|nr:hypothetical protein [Myxococcales bacterium]